MRWLRRSKVGLVLALLIDLLTYGGRYRDTHVSRASMAAALAAQAQVTDEWLARDGVVGTAVGMKNGEAVLKVYLTAAGVAALPATVAGVDVDLEVTGRFSALADPPEASVDPKAGFPRPVPTEALFNPGRVLCARARGRRRRSSRRRRLPTSPRTDDCGKANPRRQRRRRSA